jgi:hypothetical protein
VLGPFILGHPVRAQNDVFLLVDKTELTELPYFYMDRGSDGTFLGARRTRPEILA